MACNPLPQPEDDSDRHILGVIERDGWAVIGIQEEDDMPAYAFTVGMHHTFGGAELVMFGHQAETATGILNHAGQLMRDGNEFAVGAPVADLLQGFPAVLAPVDARLFREYFGYARWLYRGSNFPMLQLVWPDRESRFPWDAGYPESLFWRQRLLGACARWPNGYPFPVTPKVACFTTQQVLNGKPILHVTHDSEGSWQFHTGGRVKEADGQLVSLEAMVARDPSLVELGNLPPGHVATRETADAPWARAES
jgi:hypothetical protein